MTRQHEVELLTTGCPARRDVSFAKTALNVLVFKLAVCLWTRCELSLERQSTQMPRKSDVCPQPMLGNKKGLRAICSKSFH